MGYGFLNLGTIQDLLRERLLDGLRTDPRNAAPVDRIDSIAADLSSDGAQVTAAQVALAWVRAQGDDIVPIPGTKRTRYLDENLGALSVELSSDQLERLSTLRPAGDLNAIGRVRIRQVIKALVHVLDGG